MRTPRHLSAWPRFSAKSFGFALLRVLGTRSADLASFPLPDGTLRRFSGPLLTLKPSRCISLVDERVSGRQNGDFPTRWGPAPCPKVRTPTRTPVAAGDRLLPLRRDHGGAADDRQRICRRLGPPRPRLPRARHPPLPHPPTLSGWLALQLQPTTVATPTSTKEAPCAPTSTPF